MKTTLLMLILFAASAWGQKITHYNIVVNGDTVTSWIEIHQLPMNKREFEKAMKMLDPKFADPVDGLDFWYAIQRHQIYYPVEGGNQYAIAFKEVVRWANKWIREHSK